MEERLAKRLLEIEKDALEFDVELYDGEECQLVAEFLEKWGCRVERSLNGLRIHVVVTPECLSSSGLDRN